MTQFLLIASLFAVQVDGGVRVGGVVISERPALYVNPWLGVAKGLFDLRLQAPMVVELQSGQLRTRDWDEISDFGRIVHSSRWGHTLRVGLIQHRSLGQGTIVRRYYNGVVPDHYRIGIDWRPTLSEGSSWKPKAFEIVADQLLGYPVVATRAVWSRRRSLEFDIELALDTAAPIAIEQRLNEFGLPVHHSEVLAVYGVGVTWLAWHRQRHELSLYGHINGIESEGFGGHFGLSTQSKLGTTWHLRLSAEFMVLGEQYTWSLFDTGYLVDRWGGTASARQRATQTLGGRGGVQLEYGEIWIFGGEYADCVQSGRSDLSSWMSMPIGRTTLTAMWRQRRVQDRMELFEADTALAAIAAQVQLTSHSALSAFIAREWRTKVENNAFVPTTTVGLTILFGRAQDG